MAERLARPGEDAREYRRCDRMDAPAARMVGYGTGVH